MPQWVAVCGYFALAVVGVILHDFFVRVVSEVKAIQAKEEHASSKLVARLNRLDPADGD